MSTAPNGPAPGQDSTSKSEATPDFDFGPAIVPPQADPAAVEGIRLLTQQILAAKNWPKKLYFAGVPPNGFLTFNAPDFGPSILLFTNGHRVLDYLEASEAKAIVKEFQIDYLARNGEDWAASGARAWILNRCPRCAATLPVDIATLGAKEEFLKVWAVSEATQIWKGRIQVEKVLECLRRRALPDSRLPLQLIRDHIDCSQPSVYQLLAVIAGMEKNVEAKQAACERLNRFGPDFEWKPEQDKAPAAMIANAMNGLFKRFGMPYRVNP